MKEIRKKTICPLDCPDACGVIATVVDEKITQLEGDPDHPVTDGFLCAKFRNYPERIYHPDRILHPMRRTGKKGEGKFERITWDEAFKEITAKLKEVKEKHGSEALLPYYYAGNMGDISRSAGEGFFNRYGASHLLGTICSAAAKAGWKAHCGDLPGVDIKETENSDLVIGWGVNARVTHIHWMPMVNKARKKGAQFVIIDPYRNTTAKSADLHIKLKPGGDSALALGLLKIMHTKKALDFKFIDQYTLGFSELESYLEATNLQNFVDSSGVKSEQMHELADLLKKHPKSFIRLGLGISRNSRGAMSVRAIACLAAALGLFQGEQGKGCMLGSYAFHEDAEVLSKASLGSKGRRSINMVKLGEALNLRENPIKMMFVYSSNPMSVAPDSNSVKKGMEREDLYTVVHEHFKTPTADYADILLPATTSLENTDFFTSYGHSWAGVVEPIIKPMGEAISNFELFKKLSKKMGYTEPCLTQGIDQRVDEIISTTEGISSRVKKNWVAGKWFQSTLIEKAGNYKKVDFKFHFSIQSDHPEVPKIPCLIEGRDADHPDLISRYPYLMTTPPLKNMLNSTFGEQHLQDYGKVFVHPEDANKEHLANGDIVKLFNQRGEHHRTVKITDDTQPGLLVAEGVYWHSSNQMNLSVNALTSQAVTDLGGGGTFHEIRVQLKKTDA